MKTILSGAACLAVMLGACQAVFAQTSSPAISAFYSGGTFVIPGQQPIVPNQGITPVWPDIYAITPSSGITPGSSGITPAGKADAVMFVSWPTPSAYSVPVYGSPGYGPVQQAAASPLPATWTIWGAQLTPTQETRFARLIELRDQAMDKFDRDNTVRASRTAGILLQETSYWGRLVLWQSLDLIRQQRYTLEWNRNREILDQLLNSDQWCARNETLLRWRTQEVMGGVALYDWQKAEIDRLINAAAARAGSTRNVLGDQVVMRDLGNAILNRVLTPPQIVAVAQVRAADRGNGGIRMAQAPSPGGATVAVNR